MNISATRYLLAVLFCALAVVSIADERIDVSSFGAVPDDNLDDTPALRAAAAYCRTHPGTTLTFAPGVYDLQDSLALDIERRAISGDLGRGIEVQWQLFNPLRPFAVGLDFTGAQRLVIEAEGATLRIGGWMQVLSFVRCSDLLLKGLAVTCRRPAATEARVVSLSADYYDLSFDPQLYAYVDSIVQGRYYFYSPRRRTFFNLPIGQTELLEPGHIRIHSDRQPSIGDVLIIRYGGHYRPCIMIKECERVRIDNVCLRSFPGMGIVGHQSEDITIDALRVEPEPGRYSSTSTDATHFTSCSGSLTISNSSFCGNGDDCTNIHNYYYRAVPTDNPQTVELRIEGADLHAQSLDPPHKGDTLLLVGARDMRCLDRFVVEHVVTDEAHWRVLAHLNHTVSADVLNESLMYNYTRFPRVRILGNTVDYHNGRAFLLKARDVEVRRNMISHCTLSAIKLGAELSWREAGPVERAVVEDNDISHTGTDPFCVASCLMLSTEARETPPHVNTNITVRHNRLQSDQPESILIADAAHVLIADNQFVDAAQIIIKNSEDVRIY
ncbi:MAG: hypothetical protein IJ209_10875 [Bacteroidaceae bacterium]|nr:hypothetical protein [Bacteroidaceae bacterium]